MNEKPQVEGEKCHVGFAGLENLQMYGNKIVLDLL